jgi:hypothetical protein
MVGDCWIIGVVPAEIFEVGQPFTLEKAVCKGPNPALALFDGIEGTSSCGSSHDKACSNTLV